jgi:hypothetical protein
MRLHTSVARASYMAKLNVNGMKNYNSLDGVSGAIMNNANHYGLCYWMQKLLSITGTQDSNPMLTGLVNW